MAHARTTCGLGIGDRDSLGDRGGLLDGLGHPSQLVATLVRPILGMSGGREKMNAPNSRGILMGVALVASLAFFAVVAAWPNLSIWSVLKGLSVVALAAALGALVAVPVYSIWALDRQGQLARQERKSTVKEKPDDRSDS